MKKIMFNDKYGLTEAVLDGRKTQTRRLIPQPVINKANSIRVEYYNSTFDTITLEQTLLDDGHFSDYKPLYSYKIGDMVAVAQSYNDVIQEAFDKGHKDLHFNAKDIIGVGCNNKVFVKADLMPHHIRITNIRIERLQDISNEDCLKEGVYKVSMCDRTKYFSCVRTELFNSPREAYAALIDKVSGKGTWDSNPYVFVYDFELVD